MSYLSPIGASAPLSPLPHQEAADHADDTDAGGDDTCGAIDSWHGWMEPPYCPGEDPHPAPGQHPHRPQVGGLLHPSLAGTQVGSEG